MSEEMMEDYHIEEITEIEEPVQKKIQKDKNEKKLKKEELKQTKIHRKKEIKAEKKRTKQLKELFLVDASNDFVYFHDILQIDKEVEKQVKKMSKQKRKRFIKKYKQRQKLVLSRNIYKYNKLTFSNLNDFALYVSSHHLTIDEIAVNVLRDPVFLDWVKKNSPDFTNKLNEFKNILLELESKN